MYPLFTIISDILKVFKLAGVKNKIELMDQNEKFDKQKRKQKKQ